jgi:hypothetical protein
MVDSTGMHDSSTVTVTLEERELDKVIDAMRNAARYLCDPPDPVLLRIARDLEKKLPKN